MDRFLLHDLLEWKDNPRRMPLILRGPRQVGKSHLINQFGKSGFRQLVTVNFELSPSLKECFKEPDPAKVINGLEIRLGVTISAPDTLLFLDEIQECPEAMLALRYFREMMPELPVIAAGSLLEFVLDAQAFRMPVGRVQYLYLRPLSFEEYLHAKGMIQLVAFLRNISVREKIPEDIHQQLCGLFHEYIIVGGMPAVVYEFLASGRFQPCLAVQEALLATYRDDFGKYAKHAQFRYLQAIFERAPGLVGEQFKFSKIDDGLRSRELKPALECLVKAGIIHRIHQTAASGLPLITTRHEERYKLHFLDVGLMIKASRLPPDLLLQKNFFALNRGMVMEQVVGQELLALMPFDQAGELYYWSREKTGSQAEVDFIVSVEGQIVPIEVKSGKTGRLKSLQVFMNEKNSVLGIKISMDELEYKNKILSVPAYMTGSLERLVKELYLTQV